MICLADHSGLLALIRLPIGRGEYDHHLLLGIVLTFEHLLLSEEMSSKV